MLSVRSPTDKSLITHKNPLLCCPTMAITQAYFLQKSWKISGRSGKINSSFLSLMCRFFIGVYSVIVTMFLSNVPFRHEVIVCLSTVIRDAVIEEREVSISDKCRRQLRIAKKEEASLVSVWLSSLGIR